MALSMLSGCGISSDKTIKAVSSKSFPVLLNLCEMKDSILDIHSFGISEIKVVDSLLVVSTLDNENFWHLYSLPSLDSVGKIFNVGNGPFELPMPVPCFQSSFFHDEQNSIIVAVPQIDRQKILKINLSDFLKERDYNNAAIVDLKSSPMTIWTYCLDDNRYLQASVNAEQNQIVRNLINPSNKPYGNNGYFEDLNERKVENPEDLQLLLTTPAIKPDGGKVAEIPGFSNKVTIYDTTDDEGVIIEYIDIPGDKGIVSQYMKNNVSLFGGGYGYDNYVAIIRNDIEQGSIVNQHIDFFSWEGCQLGSINLGKKSIRRFDIDEINGILLCLDSDKDAISAYDVSSFLKRLVV